MYKVWYMKNGKTKCYETNNITEAKTYANALSLVCDIEIFVTKGYIAYMAKDGTEYLGYPKNFGGF